LFAELRTQHEINEVYEKKLKEVQDKLSRKGTGKPRTNHIADEEVIKLRKAGQKILEICRMTGLSPTTVTKILKNAQPQ
jgi:DNA invertase Pin-like site-specific DNA recombinase